MSEAPQHPISTALALNIIDIVHARDLETQKLRNDYRDARLTKDDFIKALESIEAKLADDVLGICVRTNRRLEETVDKIMLIQEQMRILRDAAAGNIPGKV